MFAPSKIAHTGLTTGSHSSVAVAKRQTGNCLINAISDFESLIPIQAPTLLFWQKICKRIVNKVNLLNHFDA
jgi:hypothetical protein